MTEKYAEKISMLMDDELQEHETANLIEGIKHDEWLKHCWERYHLIGDALKNNLPGLVKHDLAGRVSEALSAEPVYHLSSMKQRKTRGRSAAGSHNFTYTYKRPAVALALAASLAAVAVLVVPWNTGPVPGQPASSAQASLVSPVQGGMPAMAPRLAADRMGVQPLAEQQAAIAGPAAVNGHEVKVEPVLYDYLLDHNEYTDAASVQSTMLPYVRIVGYTSNSTNASNDRP